MSAADWSGRTIYLALILVVGALFALRLSGPSNLTDNDQERPASYVLDALRNDHWIIQRDWTGDIASKPPVYTWLAALASLPGGELTLFTLYLPCALAVLGASLLVAGTVARRVDRKAALLAGLFTAANPLSAKLVALARTDAVFLFTVTLTAILVLRAWERGRGWTWAWLAATAASLTKGPLGIFLGFAGLLSWFKSRREDAARPAGLRQIPGLLLLLGIGGGWFWLAWQVEGQALIQKMLKAELVSHVVRTDGPWPGTGLVLAPSYFLARFAPWSLLAAYGIWIALRHPDPRPEARRLQRFAAAWLLAGLLALGLASHQRGDLVAPLLPAGAILAALPAARALAAWSLNRLITLAVVVGIGFGLGLQWQHQSAGRSRRVFEETRGLAELAGRFRKAGGDPDRLVHTDSPFALQFFLNTMHPATTPSRAAERLRQSPEWSVATTRRDLLQASLPPGAGILRTLAAWPESGAPRVEIVILDRTAP